MCNISHASTGDEQTASTTGISFTLRGKDISMKILKQILMCISKTFGSHDPIIRILEERNKRG